MKALQIIALLLSMLLFVACGRKQQQRASIETGNKRPQTAQKLADPKLERGKAVYDETGCAVCHIIGEIGGRTGPSLNGIGKKYDAKKLREILLKPQTLNPNTVMPPFEGSEEDLKALVAYLMSLK
ncbi:MAG: c-type cytochrome [Armatimonadetes bacterium]|nr:c-type cytochrome [Armatimonadota bacterium]